MAAAGGGVRLYNWQGKPWIALKKRMKKPVPGLSFIFYGPGQNSLAVNQT
jgi:hypothetical protein